MGRNIRGLRAAALVGAGALVLLFAGGVLTTAVRWTGQAISGAVLLLTVAAIAYAAYELYGGWTAAEDDEEARTYDDPVSREESPTGSDSLGDVEREYVEGGLSESELERELDAVLNEESDDDRAAERER